MDKEMIEMFGTMLIGFGIFISVITIIAIFITWTVPDMLTVRLLILALVATITGYIMKGK